MAYIDPTTASPDNYKLLHEEDEIRLIEMTLNAGETDNQHSHKDELVYFVSGGNVRIHLPDGQSMDAEVPDGHVMAHEAWTHTVQNTGSKNVKAIIFEKK